MDPANHLRVGEIEFVITAVDENALGVEQGPHRSITEHGTGLKTGKNIDRHQSAISSNTAIHHFNSKWLARRGSGQPCLLCYTQVSPDTSFNTVLMG